MTKIDKLYINWNDVDHMVDDLINQMFADNWKPDYIVGITRGGLTPAIMICLLYTSPSPRDTA